MLHWTAQQLQTRSQKASIPHVDPRLVAAAKHQAHYKARTGREHDALEPFIDGPDVNGRMSSGPLDRVLNTATNRTLVDMWNELGSSTLVGLALNDHYCC